LDLTHRFTVPTPVDETWAHFQDIASVAECFPGAAVTSVEDETFHGTVKVKLGPIALVYNGSGTFVERDETAHRFVVDANGKDKRGNGTAGARVTLEMHPSDGAEGTATDVEVVTDLSITGKPAQFGRGVMQDVSDKLLGQFVDCLEHRLAGPEAGTHDRASGAEAPAADDQAPRDTGPAAEASAARAAPSALGPPTTTRPAPASRGSDDALDLGATVLPVLLRTYWKPVVATLATLVALVVLRRLLRRG
jgi:carbon monoxide dehydrogenase subunit G